MARNISAASLQKLAQTHGTEPVTIVDITWALGGNPVRYASKDVSAPNADGTTVEIPGKIQDTGTIDSVVAISMNETSSELPLIISDTDGSIKSIIDNNDIMLRDVSVYQWFEGLQFDDRFLVFQGKINSPISYSDTDRTIKFSVLSQLEDKSVGFSPDEGQFPDLPDDMVGKQWPECFGTSVHQEAIQVDYKHAGTLGDGVGLRDFTLPDRISAIGQIRSFLSGLGVLYSLAAGFAGFLGLSQAQDQLTDQANGFFAQAAQRAQEIVELTEILNDQIATERSNFRVIGGEGFPRGSIKLNIDDAIFTGSFSGDTDIFNVSCADQPERKNFHVGTTPCGNPGCELGNCKQFPQADGVSITQSGGSTAFLPNGNIIGEQAGAYFAQAGAGVTMESAEPIRYFVSITPGTVKKVAAFSTFDSGERVLIDLPTDLYSVYTQSYGSVSVTVVEVNNALSKLTPAYEDTIYVTFESSVGPNTIDIMTYLIGKYADIGIDTASFGGCRAALENYPMHFCLHEKKNIVTVLKELAFMARLAVFIQDGKFFCRYLPAEPPSIFTFSEDNVLTQSVELGFTGTEELVTEYIANWRAHGAQDEDNKSVVRTNVKKYGTHTQTVDFYAYNYVSAVVKSLTFWVIRRGHTWKKLKFQAALDALNVQTFDGVTLDFTADHASTDSTLSCVESANYNVESNTIDFDVWTGVRSGDMEQYDLAYPQNVSVDTTFPDEIATAEGFAGGDGPGKTSTGNINRQGQRQGVSVSFPNNDPYQDGDRRRQDLGAAKPSDLGDSNPGSPEVNDVGAINFTDAPPDTTQIINTPINTNGEVFWIDIRTTEIADSNNPGSTATLSSFFEEVTGGVLKGKTGATWKGDGQEAAFDFKYDTTGAKFGAGTAFLKDD